jgi:1,4-dihydroxy-6-naphthoate synthase
MFYALAKDRIDTGAYSFEHELVDIETLNRRAQRAELELTAVSLHAYAYLADKYMLCTCGASMGDDYGPIVVARDVCDIGDLSNRVLAVPGTWTTAFLSLRLCLGSDFQYVVVPFDAILAATAAGQYEGERVDAGLVIHEGQLTYMQDQLHLIVDLGKWWKHETGMPLPLGANAIRKDLGVQAMADVNRLLFESIRYGLDHRREALQYALSFGRGLDEAKADRFVGMYVNDWTLDFGSRGREAVATLLQRGHAAGLIPTLVRPEFVS